MTGYISRHAFKRVGANRSRKQWTIVTGRAGFKTGQVANLSSTYVHT